MVAVWSFWTKPWRARYGFRWSREKHHMLAWVLSVECARQHYPETTLITDDDGARMLVDGLGLRVTHVSTALNGLAHHDPALWMLGKLYAYRAQTEPFVHLDTDVFLWKRLRDAVEQAPVFAQHPELFAIGASHYKPEQMRSLMTERTRGWIPREWEWALSFGSPQRAACCGVVGGNHVEFLRYYAETAIRLIEEPRNRRAWSTVADQGEYNTLIEQYHLAACVDYHRNRPDSPYRDLEIRYLFDSFEQAFDPKHAAAVGLTHLLAGAKQNRTFATRIEERVARDCPEAYGRCIDFANRCGL